jgi:sulfatase modifying factor 1
MALQVGHANERSAVTACQTPDRAEVHIPSGTFLMGSDDHPEEGPVRRVTVKAFSIDRFDVTNADFDKFVKATGYLTDAERKPNAEDYSDIRPEQLSAGGAVFARGSDPPQGEINGWSFVPGANWRHPHGPKSSIVGREHEPVVQVSYQDALAYARWTRRELPTEEQYEFAARGGLEGKTFAWGDELKPGGKWMANTWQGQFPAQNTSEDGFRSIAPVGCFSPNGYGLYDMTGNVWKWTSSRYQRDEPPGIPASRIRRTAKGGSFLCSTNYCRRFRPSARQPQESGFSSVHLGFRTVSNR